MDSSEGKITAQVAIVGAGPSGTATALRLAQLGIRDVVLLDLHDFPRDKTCGSGLSPRAVEVLKELRVWQSIQPLAYPIDGMRLVTPGGYDVHISGGKKHEAFVCLRRVLDHAILKEALGLGIRFVPHFKVSEPIERAGRWVGVKAADGREVQAEYTIIANGAHSKWVLSEEPKHMIHTIMGWWQGVKFHPHAVEMFWDKMLGGYYGWLFPETEDRVNIGITYPDDSKVVNAKRLFKKFIDKHFERRLRDATQVGSLKGHPILFGYKLGRLGSPGRIVVGEAGRMTHPATGEGIYQGMRSGMFAAEALRDVLLKGKPETEAILDYEKRCARTFLPSFWAGGAFVGMVKTPALDWAVGATSRPMVRNAIARALAHM